MPKIMIIEDDQAIREELVLLLENEGYTAIAVTDFTAILDQAAWARPDLFRSISFRSSRSSICSASRCLS